MDDLLNLIKRYVADRKTATALAEALIDSGMVVYRPHDSEVDQVTTAFTKSFGTTSTSRYDRYAATRLIKRYPPKELIKIIEILAQHRGDAYCPVIGNVHQLEQKWVSVQRFLTTLSTRDNDIKV